MTSKTMQEEEEACASQHFWVLSDISDRRVFNAQLVPSSKHWLFFQRLYMHRSSYSQGEDRADGSAFNVAH